MAAIIGALRAELSASIAQFQSDMGKAADSLKGFSKQAESISKGLDSVGKKMSLAITAPLLLLAKAGLDEAKQAREAMGQVTAALESTGGASGKTAVELQKSAKALQNLSTFDDDEILRNVTANLLTFGNIQGDVFDKAQLAVVNLASRMGGDLAGASIKVGRALNDPIGGMKALTRLGIAFNTNQQETIKSMVKNGQGLQAQGMILDALSTKFGHAAAEMRAASPDAVLAQNWRDFKETIGGIVIELLPALTDKLKVVFEWFQNLSPETKKWVVELAAFAAIIGPILVVFSKLVTAVAILTPIMKGLFLWFSGLSLVTIAWVAGLVAVAAAVIIFWKTIKDVLHGDFKKAWEDAKDSASTIAKQITGIFGTIKGPDVAKTAAAAVAGGGGKVLGSTPGKLDFDQHNEAEITKAREAAKKLTENLAAVQTQLQHGLDQLQLPQATTNANALNAKIDDYVKAAKDAGVNTAGWGGQVDLLKAKIEAFRQVGLSKEAEAFTREVSQTEVAVKRLAANGLDPLADKLDTVDSQFESLKLNIEKQIDENAALADSNASAAAAMDRLKVQLSLLDKAHQSATDAARAQFAAEEKLATLQTAGNNLETAAQIRDLKNAQGGGGPVSDQQAQLQAANDDLAKRQIDVATHLTQLEAQRDAAAAQGFDSEVARLNSEIDLQTQLFDLVSKTTGEQLVAAQRIDGAFKDFTSDLTNNLSNSIQTWSFDLKGIDDIFRNLATQMFIKPGVQAGADAFSGLLKSIVGGAQGSGSGGGMFAGMFAGGGYIPPGQWGIVGENGPEPAFGGASGMSVQQSGTAGVTQVFNITTPNANSFRMSQRQIATNAKRRLSA